MEIDLRPSSRTKGIVDRQAILLNELFCIANVFFFLTLLFFPLWEAAACVKRRVEWIEALTVIFD